MKKILSILLLALIAVGIISCKDKEVKVTPKISKKDNLLNEAKKGLNYYIKDKVYNPDAFKMSETQIVYSSDSACVIKFRFIAENRVGGHVNGKAQWIWLKHDGETYMSWQDSTNEDIYEFGDSWIIEDGVLQALSIFNVCMEVAEKDSFAYKRIYKDDTANFGDDYTQLYCIVKATGMKVKDNKNNTVYTTTFW